MDIKQNQAAEKGDITWSAASNESVGMKTSSAVPEKTGPTDAEPSDWNTALKDFCQNSTIHGISYATNDSYNGARRFIWTCLSLAGMSLFIMQVTQSVIYYTSWPVTVNIKMYYNNSLKFPAVTICNQNSFRLTKTASMGLYQMVEDYYTQLGSDEPLDLSVYGAENITLDELYLATGHTLDNMLMSCTWDQGPCNMSYFTETITDYGLCFTFNAAGKDLLPLSVSFTGANRGLSLGLNLEQYEYMAGPNPGAGVKIQVHDNTDVPMVGDFALAIPPGSRAFVSSSITAYDNIERPYGRCSDQTELTYYPGYSPSTCMLDCYEIFLAEQCGCRDIGLLPSQETNYPPSCTLNQYQVCGIQAVEEYYSNMSAAGCQDCPDPCYQVIYTATVTYTETSEFDARLFFANYNVTKLADSFLQAREDEQRVVQDIVSYDEVELRKLMNIIDTLDALFNSTVKEMTRADQEISESMSELAIRTYFHQRWGIDKVIYIMDHDFVRGWDVRMERGIDTLTNHYWELAEYLEHVVIISRDLSWPDNDTLITSYYIAVEQALTQRIVAAERAQVNITQVQEAYLTGDPLVNFDASPDNRYDMSWITLEVVQASDDLTDSNVYPNFIARAGQFGDATAGLLESMSSLYKRGEPVNWEEFYEWRLYFENRARSYNYYRFSYENKIVLIPSQYATEHLNTFLSLNSTTFQVFAEFNLLVNDALVFLSEVGEAWATFRDVSEMCGAYLSGNITKLELGMSIVNEQYDLSRQTMAAFFSEAKTRSSAILTYALQLKASLQNLWGNMLSETMLHPFYDLVHNDVNLSRTDPAELEYFDDIFASMLDTSTAWVVANLDALDYYMNADFNLTTVEDKMKELDQLFDDWNGQFDVGSTYDGTDVAFLDQAVMVYDDLDAYLKDCELDTEFYKKNFMYIDVYMKQLSYEEIQQQKAYDMTALWCDIGGSIGLFIGASALSVFEILDVFLVNFIKINLSGRRR